MSSWPAVVGEYDTISKIKEGYSIARFGDGEFGVMRGRGYTRYPEVNLSMTRALTKTFDKPNDDCLIGIPTMDPTGDKYANWKRHKASYLKRLNPDVTYYSAFISRPDCGTAWMEKQEYADALRSIWAGKHIALVSESYSKVLTDLRNTGETHDHIECPMYRAYDFINDYETEIMRLKPDIVLLCLGVAATILANRLAGHGIHAIDLGSVGGFLSRWQPKSS